jgi:hypothetical protein
VGHAIDVAAGLGGERGTAHELDARARVNENDGVEGGVDIGFHGILECGSGR